MLIGQQRCWVHHRERPIVVSTVRQAYLWLPRRSCLMLQVTSEDVVDFGV